MRWYWIDQFEKFVVGEEAVAIKNVTLAEEPIHGYCPDFPHYPHSLMIEGMAQTGGLLLSQIEDFTQKIVLAKVSKADFEDIAVPGETIRLTAKLVNRQPDGAIVEGKIEVQEKLIAEMTLAFAILDDKFGKEPFFVPGDLCRILRAMKLFQVGVHPNGDPIQVPQHMLDDEKRCLTERS